MSDYDGSVIDGDFAVDLYALRTFKVADGRLASLVQPGNHWHNGECVAACLAGEHEAPAENCRCGVYGTLGVDALFEQYGNHARHVVAVIAAEGTTVIGDIGLRTSAARVVAYWCSAPDDRILNKLLDICARHCPEARRFFDLDAMAITYDLEPRIN